ncbi:hypothetical protein F4821DRAFT_115991 [Hypoxylon rubiginosum]|uniref:Uncharacterized protein n=1 Tax=Hypoxylon rubiginosum TaxID=110542 RepID=A0ACC0D3A2_9PEZI|nr:hypothetical protein F4821DRAFT_115991 [Hypoxylon rubiginosum]
MTFAGYFLAVLSGILVKLGSSIQVCKPVRSHTYLGTIRMTSCLSRRADIFRLQERKSETLKINTFLTTSST